MIAQETGISRITLHPLPKNYPRLQGPLMGQRLYLDPVIKMRLESSEFGVVEFNLAVKWSPEKLNMVMIMS